jgi:hypothetical protein
MTAATKRGFHRTGQERLKPLLVLEARTPLSIIAHILPGRPVIVGPTLDAMSDIGAVRHHGADLTTAEPAAADVHNAATGPHGEGRGCYW